jgi:NAD-dependent SIR2 family protein deacetylase
VRLAALPARLCACHVPRRGQKLVHACVQFMASEASQRRYWARSFVGWLQFADAQPSGAHEGLARLQAAGWLPHILTQNVDRLHQKAGARDVLELHGTTHKYALSRTACYLLSLFTNNQS